MQTTTKFDFDDVLIQPCTLTNIVSRYDDVSPYLNGNQLPLFTAPMDTVVNEHTRRIFTNNGIHVVLPRTVKHKFNAWAFNSLSLNEFEKEIPNIRFRDHQYDGWHVLIDIANGHMSKIIRCAEQAKKKNHTITIMAGNIANPDTYGKYCESQVIDYVRVGIGNGNGCLTTQQTGIGYPMGSLIAECNEIKKSFDNPTKIIADGGMKKYADIIKALALGADYVMLGSVLNKALESASPNYWKGIKLPDSVARWMYDHNFELYKEFRGMSTKKSQALMGNKTIRTSEGVVKKQKVEYTLEKWVENFESYLRSAMSYTNHKHVAQFIGNVNINLITQNAYNRYNK